MKTEGPEEGVTVVRGDGKLVGLRLDDPREVVRLPRIIEALGLDADRVGRRLRADADVLLAQPGGHLGQQPGLSRRQRRTGSCRGLR